MDISRIPLADIPADGLHLVGELPSSLFDLGPDDAHPTGPLVYRLDLMPTGTCLLATGKVSADFDLECVRCLTRFPHTIDLDPYSAEIEPDDEKMIRLTERLREDILLVLPAYPHCDQSFDGRECPVGDRFTSQPAGDADEPGEPPGPPPEGAWDVLGAWKPSSPEN